jgi:hypothetical protein
MKETFDLPATETEGPLTTAPTKTLSEHSQCLYHRYSTVTEEFQVCGPGGTGDGRLLPRVSPCHGLIV